MIATPSCRFPEEGERGKEFAVGICLSPDLSCGPLALLSPLTITSLYVGLTLPSDSYGALTMFVSIAESGSRFHKFLPPSSGLFWSFLAQSWR